MKNSRTFRLSDNQFEMLRILSEKTKKSQGRVIEDMIMAFYGLYVGNPELYEGMRKHYEADFELFKNSLQKE